MFVYYPSCTFRKILPDTAKTVIDFLKEDMTMAGCCRAKKYRSEDPAPASEICEQYDVSTHELMGSRWYKIRAKGVVPRGKTEKILYLHGGGFVLETGAAEYLYAE